MESIFDKGASLPAMRFLTALSMRKPDKVEDMSRQLWLRLWGQVHIAPPVHLCMGHTCIHYIEL